MMKNLIDIMVNLFETVAMLFVMWLFLGLVLWFNRKLKSKYYKSKGFNNNYDIVYYGIWLVGVIITILIIL